MKRYNLSKLFKKAWSLYRKAAKKAAVTFGEALKAAWAWLKVQAENNALVEAVANFMGIQQEYHSWAGWQALGRMVIHTSKAAFKVTLKDPLTRNGLRVQSFFLYEDTQPMPMAA